MSTLALAKYNKIKELEYHFNKSINMLQAFEYDTDKTISKTGGDERALRHLDGLIKTMEHNSKTTWNVFDEEANTYVELTLNQVKTLTQNMWDYGCYGAEYVRIKISEVNAITDESQAGIDSVQSITWDYPSLETLKSII